MSPKSAWFADRATIVGLAAGQVLFKMGALRVERDASTGPLAYVNTPVVLAVAVYAVSTILWITALRALPLRIARPVSALTYALVPLLGHYFLSEPVGVRAFAGAALIVAGVAVASSGD